MNRPKVSVVIATHNAAKVLDKCLAALVKQVSTHQVEIIVASSSTDGTAKIVQENFPEVNLLHFDEPFSIPLLRQKALDNSKGEIIAILDPYSIIDDDWLEQMMAAHSNLPNLVIGGAVEIFSEEPPGISNWTIYIHEYGGFMPPLKEGVVSILPGSNISYKREALSKIKTLKLKQRGFWKAYANWHLEDEGHKLWLAPSIVVRLWKPIPFFNFLRTRFHHGRCYASMRVADSSFTKKLIHALKTPLLPFVFSWRLTMDFWPKSRDRGKYLLASPLLFLLNFSWALGELIGYLRGSGDSCALLFY
ncbi:MAG: glycosyltransferase [Chloroflexi bacterium]|nr:glycosyltransferase [Chloroflexota bacterium]